jgi:hypothetical protein
VTLAIALATRGRPMLLLDTVARTLPNIVLPSTVLHLMLDEDDAPTRSAVDTARIGWSDRVVVNVAPREDTVAEKFNRVLSDPADIYTAMVDHTAHVTRGFDQKIVEAAELFPDGIGLVVNHLANASFTGAYAPTRGMVEKMGYLFPPYFPYWFIDHWLDDVARLIGRMVVADVVTDSSRKPMTQEMREPDWWATFYDAAYLMRRQQALDIINSHDFYEPHWRKILLERHPTLWPNGPNTLDFRSRHINDTVRSSAAEFARAANLSLNDQRYQRVKARAVSMVPHLLDDYGMRRDEADAFRKRLCPPTNVINLKQAYA